MKVSAHILLFVLISFCLISCGKSPDPTDMLSDFVSEYSAEGIIYSPSVAEGEPGYLEPEIAGKIFAVPEELPRSYAIFLNSRADFGSECGVFVCDSTQEVYRVLEMCERRMKLLRGGDRSLLIRSGNTVFYSTMSDRSRAEKLWREILRSHTR